MSIQTYSAERITMLKQTLLNSAEASKPRDYEIRVDDMKVVPRTNDTEQFDNYEEFVTEETKKIIVLIYDGTSPAGRTHRADHSLHCCLCVLPYREPVPLITVGSIPASRFLYMVV